ncbi:MAG: thiolase family protein [Candidatus Neomarinimicrobiota bacterium]|jgi:acetyl-CoA C-acetyltransferase|nr:thiolase family protein [Candidatus Neomarinimicrobiota bacterium]
MSRHSVIINAKRTPVGAFRGYLAELSAPQLGAVVIRDLIASTGLEKIQVDEVIMGNVLSSGLGQAPARQAAIYGGLPNSVECLTINKMCGSGLKAVMLGDQVIRSGDAAIVIAGGMESMSNAPYLLPKARGEHSLGHRKMIDSIIHDGLWDAYNDLHMGNCAEMCAKDRKYTREDQDKFAITSYKRAQMAQAEGFFDNEIVPVKISTRNDDPVSVKDDEEPKRARFEKISLLKPAFEKNGTVTAANASKLNDAAAAVVIMTDEKANKLGLKPMARIVAHCSVAHAPEWFTTAPGKAIGKILKKTKMNVEDLDLWEINEAFSAVAMAAIDDFHLDPAKVNINGGAVALGHPIGASGARILTSLLYGLQRTEGRFGLASICIGGGEASALIVEQV